MLIHILLLALAVGYGWALLGLLVPGPARSWAWMILRLAFGALLGLGLTALLFFGWLVVVGQASRWYFLLEALLGGGLLLGAMRVQRRQPRAAERLAGPRPGWSVVAVAGAAVALAAGSIGYTLIMNAHGAYDAWAFWNTHARFLFRAGAEWRRTLVTMHGDYPYLLPAAVARLWTGAGHDGLGAPGLIATLISASIGGLLVGGLSLLADRTRALLAVVALLSASHYIYDSAALTADVPLSLFCLATIVALILALDSASSHEQRGWIAVAGVSAGLAAWTKNEGLLFVVIVGLAWLGMSWYLRRTHRFRHLLLPALAGLALPLVGVLIFKATLAPPSDLAVGQTAQSVSAKLTDGGRYAAILKSYALTLGSYGRGMLAVLVVASVLLGFQRPARVGRGGILALLVVLGMLAGYAGVYLLTPYDLTWHLGSSLVRLVTQIWPMLILGLLLLTRPLSPVPAPQGDPAHTESPAG